MIILFRIYTSQNESGGIIDSLQKLGWPGDTPTTYWFFNFGLGAMRARKDSTYVSKEHLK